MDTFEGMISDVQRVESITPRDDFTGSASTVSHSPTHPSRPPAGGSTPSPRRSKGSDLQFEDQLIARLRIPKTTSVYSTESSRRERFRAGYSLTLRRQITACPVAFNDRKTGNMLRFEGLSGAAGGIQYAVNNAIRPTIYYMRYEEKTAVMRYPELSKGCNLPALSPHSVYNQKILAALHRVSTEAGTRFETRPEQELPAMLPLLHNQNKTHSDFNSVFASIAVGGGKKSLQVSVCHVDMHELAAFRPVRCQKKRKSSTDSPKEEGRRRSPLFTIVRVEFNAVDRIFTFWDSDMYTGGKCVCRATETAGCPPQRLRVLCLAGGADFVYTQGGPDFDTLYVPVCPGITVAFTPMGPGAESGPLCYIATEEAKANGKENIQSDDDSDESPFSFEKTTVKSRLGGLFKKKEKFFKKTGNRGKEKEKEKESQSASWEAEFFFAHSGAVDGATQAANAARPAKGFLSNTASFDARLQPRQLIASFIYDRDLLPSHPSASYLNLTASQQQLLRTITSLIDAAANVPSKKSPTQSALEKFNATVECAAYESVVSVTIKSLTLKRDAGVIDLRAAVWGLPEVNESPEAKRSEEMGYTLSSSPPASPKDKLVSTSTHTNTITNLSTTCVENTQMYVPSSPPSISSLSTSMRFSATCKSNGFDAKERRTESPSSGATLTTVSIPYDDYRKFDATTMTCNLLANEDISDGDTSPSPAGSPQSSLCTLDAEGNTERILKHAVVKDLYRCCVVGGVDGGGVFGSTAPFGFVLRLLEVKKGLKQSLVREIASWCAESAGEVNVPVVLWGFGDDPLCPESRHVKMSKQWISTLPHDVHHALLADTKWLESRGWGGDAAVLQRQAVYYRGSARAAHFRPTPLCPTKPLFSQGFATGTGEALHVVATSAHEVLSHFRTCAKNGGKQMHLDGKAQKKDCAVM